MGRPPDESDQQGFGDLEDRMPPSLADDSKLKRSRITSWGVFGGSSVRAEMEADLPPKRP